MRRQFFELRPGETLIVDGSRITLEAKTGRIARLRVESDVPTSIDRGDSAPVARPQQDSAPAPLPFLQRPQFAG